MSRRFEMTNPPEPVHRPWSMFFGWLLVGALWMTGIASLPSIGIFILPLAGVATWLLARRPGSRRGMPGLISTAGLFFFLLARLNRNGQGTILRSTSSGGVTGFKQSNPGPWVAVGVLFIVASVVVFLVTTRRRA